MGKGREKGEVGGIAPWLLLLPGNKSRGHTQVWRVRQVLVHTLLMRRICAMYTPGSLLRVRLSYCWDSVVRPCVYE